MFALRQAKPIRSFRSFTTPLSQYNRIPIGIRALGTIPQPPGGIVGTVNDPVPIPPSDKTHGSYHWTFERVAAASLVPIIAIPFAAGSLHPLADSLLGSLLILHSHIGLSSCITDYIPKRVYGSIHNLAVYALYGGSALALYGLYQFETTDVGISEGIRKIWHS